VAEKKDAAAEKPLPPIIIKKIKKGGGHHGGAWKVAYADFVTAMMAFFLLLWLLNVTTEEQLNAISNYFDPTHPKVSEAMSGAGGVLGGLSMSPQGAMSQDTPSATMQQHAQPTSSAQQGYQDDPEKVTLEQAKEILREEEEERYKDAEEQIKQAIQDDPELAALSKNLIIDMTPEGLRIQIVDQDGQPMFPSGSAQMYEKTRHLMSKVGGIIKTMPNELSVRGHTDSVPYGKGADYTNWELSSDRSNASRRVFIDAGIPEARVNNVMGKADTEPLVKDDPKAASNRRISIILLREELTNPDFEKKAEAAKDKIRSKSPAAAPTVPIGTFRKTPGQVEFP
jgi:chemotaxis protein MotB